MNKINYSELTQKLNTPKSGKYLFENEKGFLMLSNEIEFHLGKKLMKEYWFNENDIYLEKIYSNKPNKWYWNYLLNMLLDYAKATNKHIILSARAEKRLSQKQLEEWYKRNWFKKIEWEFGDFFHYYYF